MKPDVNTVMLSNIKVLSYFKVESKLFDHFDLKEFKKALPKFKKIKFESFDLDKEQRENIFKYGLTNIINPDYECLIGRPQTRREDFIQAMQKFLDSLLKGKSLVVIDNYIFPKKFDADYVPFLIDILKKYIPKLNKITFVTSPSFNRQIQIKIFSEIKKHNQKINLTLQHSEEFHDRFWISPRNRKGIFMGTSLNGLGKKYTLIDYIQEEDTREIMNGLRKISYL